MTRLPARQAARAVTTAHAIAAAQDDPRARGHLRARVTDAAHPRLRPTAQRQLWLDLVKGLALAWIVLNHLTERLFGEPYIANPSSTWPPLAERIAQLRPLTGHGLWDLPLNFVRYTGWAGDQGVQLFLLASGFGLTWGLLARQRTAPLRLSAFYSARAKRIYPLWWAVHLAFLVVSVMLGRGLRLDDPAFYLSMAGIRATPSLLYYFAPAWWYIGLLIQFYLVYPLLWEGLRRRGPLWLLLTSCTVAFIARGAGLLFLSHGVDAWSRGAIFITRLPEFVFGISMAAYLYNAPARADQRLRSAALLPLVLVCYGIGTLLSLTLAGMTVAPFLLGAPVFVLLYAALGQLGEPSGYAVRTWRWIGEHSYSLFLVHHPLILYLLPRGGAGWSVGFIVGDIVALLLLTAAGAVALERVVAVAQRVGRAGWLKVALAAVTAYALLIGADLAIRSVDPQEVFGWGERPSLEPNPVYGWRLKPSRETELRWESYDYRITANALGFPGPVYPPQKALGVLRIMTTGDAFTSAEGVDTERAWPRLLETDLAARLPGHKVEVLNFAITGYGPNQYAAVVQAFGPIYRPDVIIVGFFVNDFDDVLHSNAAFRESIGFDRPQPDSWHAIVGLAEVRRLVRLRIVEPLYGALRGRPGSHGYFLGQFGALERQGTDLTDRERRLVAERLAQIKAVADTVNARVLIAMIPAPVQVCAPSDLGYYPRHVNLEDTTQFDLDRPQRMARGIAESLHVGYYDLRSVLRAAPEGCPYQRWNLHWTRAGHRVVATALADRLIEDGYLRGTQ